MFRKIRLTTRNWQKFIRSGLPETADTTTSIVQDKITITGIPLDGWSGGSEKEAWVLPVYGHGDALVLKAISAVHITTVKAYYIKDGRTSAPIEMKLANPDTYVKDGYKRWYASTMLPDQIEAGNYGVTFVASDSANLWTETDSVQGPVGANNPFVVKYKLTVQGQITDAVTHQPIAGASVALIDPASGKKVAETKSDGTSNYQFNDVTVNRYTLAVQHDGYADANIDFYASPKDGTENTIIVNASLSPYRITLEADPSTLLGDGKSETTLTATIVDTNGKPPPGVQVHFASPTGKGTFPNGTTAVTDANGKAAVPFRSDLVTGAISQRIPVTADVQDPARGLSASRQLVITFDPGAIAGVVTEMVNGEPKPVAGAEVVVTKDFNDDGVTDFMARAVTKADGAYLIAIPRGNTKYNLTITKPVQVGGQTVSVPFPQTVSAGTITENGKERFSVDKAGAGVVLIRTPDQQTSLLSKALYSKMKGYLLNAQGEVLRNPDGTRLEFSVNDNGAFNVQGLNEGTYQLAIVTEVAPGREIIVNRGTDGKPPILQLKQNGELNIALELIDPYGTVTDANTGEVIEGAQVQLLYADTQRNRDNGRKPGELVSLPELIGFAPNDNHNPQQTDALGKYAYMVYGFTDYTIVVSKPRYYTHTSQVISVEDSIVRYDVQLRPVRDDSSPVPASGGSAGGSTGGSAGGSAGSGTSTTPGGNAAGNTEASDLAVELWTDRAAYPEGGVITYTIEYANKSGVKATGVKLTAQIPMYTTVLDAAKGVVNQSNIEWTLGDLEPGAKGTISYKVQVVDKQFAEGGKPGAERSGHSIGFGCSAYGER
ncbi:carboxypeptidase regulatory-like domain-containing protein [Paenibacillus sp. P26]|nr:carboxypeptidase regulatory-like domain-containing protein [Paenibacillus sp. P26]